MDDIVERLWASDEASALTNEAARNITALREKNEALERMVITQAEEAAEATKYWMARVKELEEVLFKIDRAANGNRKDKAARISELARQALKGDKQS